MCLQWSSVKQSICMMTSSNGNIFRVTGHLCGEFTGPGEFPTQRPVTRSFDVYFDLRPNKRLSKQSWDCRFETQSRSLWRHCNGTIMDSKSGCLWLCHNATCYNFPVEEVPCVCSDKSWHPLATVIADLNHANYRKLAWFKSIQIPTCL